MRVAWLHCEKHARGALQKVWKESCVVGLVGLWEAFMGFDNADNTNC